MRVLIRWSVESATTVDSYAGHLKGRMDVIWRILQSVMRNPAAWFDLGDLIESALNQQHASDDRDNWSLNGPLVSRNAAARRRDTSPTGTDPVLRGDHHRDARHTGREDRP